MSRQNKNIKWYFILFLFEVLVDLIKLHLDITTFIYEAFIPPDIQPLNYMLQRVLTIIRLSFCLTMINANMTFYIRPTTKKRKNGWKLFLIVNIIFIISSPLTEAYTVEGQSCVSFTYDSTVTPFLKKQLKNKTNKKRSRRAMRIKNQITSFLSEYIILIWCVHKALHCFT